MRASSTRRCIPNPYLKAQDGHNYDASLWIQ